MTKNTVKESDPWKPDFPRPKGYEDYTFPMTVTKPWGRERWLELWHDPETGLGYCMKQLYIREGTMTSLQYHQDKLETNFLVSGRLEAYLEGPKGSRTQVSENGTPRDIRLEKKIMVGGDEEKDTWSIQPGRIHRIKALTDIYLVETSTWHVDDVTRLSDTYGRESGKIASEHGL